MIAKRWMKNKNGKNSKKKGKIMSDRNEREIKQRKRKSRWI